MSGTKLIGILVLGLAFGLPVSGADRKIEPVKVSVDGTGLLRDRELQVSLKRLLSVGERETIDANAIEDAAVILTSALGEEGFQTPEVNVEARLVDGAEKKFVFDPTFASPLPRPLEAREVRFRVEPGVRSHIAEVELAGLTAIPEKEARALFRMEGTLIAAKRTNAYSPSRVSRAADALLGQLRQRGYARAVVEAKKTRENEGAITVRVEVREGDRWDVTDVHYQRDETGTVALPSPENWIGRPWTPTLQEDIREAIRQAYYREGYPDIGVHVDAEPAAIENGRVPAEVVATIVPGPQVKVGEVRLEGNAVTRESVLRRRVRLNSGDLLNPIAFERARYRISRLGVFEVVDLHYEPEDGPVRDPVFVLREGSRYETSVLMGWGSYEQLRAGVEHRQMNIFGLAHQSRIEAVQSMKSSSADYTYTVPELFGESMDGTAKLFGLQRKELAFLRQEFGLSLSLKRAWRRTGGDITAGYTFQMLRNRRNELSTQATDDRQLNVASLNFGLTGDRRDNPLRPRHGYHWSSQIEAAEPRLGGESTYQRLEVAGAYHTSWGEGRWIHVALSHGFITTLGAPDDLSLPVNKRFYPGGDNSVRGYQRGEAAPIGPDGRYVGAKAYAVFNLELEQALTPSWSIVAFSDTVGTAISLRDYPFSERLYSVGLGVRYQTLIGPIRLEYGRNINRRATDPAGTWHFSIGYPF